MVFATGSRRTLTLVAFIVQGAVFGAGCVAEVKAPTMEAAPTPTPAPGAGTCLPPTQLRRLSIAELQRSLDGLLPSVDVDVAGLPTDPRPAEFDNDATALQPSDLLIEGLHTMAKDVAAQVVAQRGDLLGCDTAAAGCVLGYAEGLAQRAFRRPIDAEERADLASLVDTGAGAANRDVALALAVEYILQSPGFLYRIDAVVVDDDGRAHVDAVSLASRLSFFLWGQSPDDALLQAALAGELQTQAQIDAQVTRLLADPRAADAALAFHRQWLDFGRLDRTVKADDDGFTRDIREGYALEQDALVTQTLFANNASIATLLTTREAWVTPAVAAVYGVAAPDDGGPIELPAQRGGFLRRGGFLSAHAHPKHPSPVQRGVFVLRHLLCTELGTPPANADVSPPVPGDDDPITTNRQSVEARTAPESCQGCHRIINPIGFAFEGFDTVGRQRTTDNGQPIDDSGALFGDTVQGADGLMAELVARSDEVERCAVRKLLTSAWGSVDAGWQECLVDQVQAAAPTMGLRDLLFAVATSESFRAATPVGDTVGAP